MRSIFSDKATAVIRAMLSEPDRKWTVRDFEKEFGISKSRAAAVLSVLRKKGYVGGVSAGRSAHSTLTDKKVLIEEWVKFYNFDFNKVHLYYFHQENILSEVRKYFEENGLSDNYALTLHTGSNFITNYVNTQSIYCYLNVKDFNKISLDLRQRLNLKELKKGGNFFLVEPYYKHTVFFNKMCIKGYEVVSYLQLYLDLINFPQRGREHAEYLLKVLQEKGESFV